jgi:DNA-binding MarR family transcriptional regulator
MAGTGHDDLKLDSAYFVALEMGHSTLKHALMEASDLNITQYRILVKVYAVSPAPIALVNLSKLLRLKANVVTQATDTLEAKGLVQRRKSVQDARMRMLSMTEEGLRMIGHVNEALVKRLYAEWPTGNPLYRTSLEACIIAGAAIEPPASDRIREFPASRTLVSFELIRQTIETAMRKAIDAPYNDCRILQRLYEA